MQIIRTNMLQKIADVVIDFNSEYYAHLGILNRQEYGPIINAQEWPEYVRIFIKTDLLQDQLPFLKSLRNKFHLMTGSSDLCANTIPGLVGEILRNTQISSWTGNNLIEEEPMMMCIPIGLTRAEIKGGEEILSHYIHNQNLPKIYNILMSWVDNTSPSRGLLKEIISQDSKNRIFFQKEKLKYSAYVEQLKQSIYVLCPEGNGIDTHRIYETILANSIPIVLRSPLWKMHRDLGCIVLDKWEKLFNIPEFPGIRTTKMESISCTRWLDMIYHHQQQFNF